MLPPQMRRADASMPADPIQARAGAGVADTPHEETAAFFAQTDVMGRMRDVTDMANRNNTAIYSLDPRGLAVFEYDLDDVAGPPPSFATDKRTLQMTTDTLRVLSEQTDGRAIVNRNSLLQGLNQIIRDSSYYYLIGYNSKAPTDGKFHPDQGPRQATGRGRPRAPRILGRHARGSEPRRQSGQGSRQAGADGAGVDFDQRAGEPVRPDVGGQPEGGAAARRT
jgi:hypothetical protein